MPWTSSLPRRNARDSREDQLKLKQLEEHRWSLFIGSREDKVNIQLLTRNFPILTEAMKKFSMAEHMPTASLRIHLPQQRTHFNSLSWKTVTKFTLTF
jgi:hypothetical protein